jgi:type IX secretion system PorP/SprF family membrane protein
MKSLVKSLLIGMLLVASVLKTHAQDYQFSQFYANILYLNPAFAGSAHKNRIILHQRLQWPSLDAKYTSSAISFDHYFNKTNSGIGILYTKDVQGGSNISTNDIQFQYSYELHITEKYSFRAGLQAGYVSRYVNYSILNFPDQYSINGPTSTNSAEPFGSQKKDYLDLSSGGVFYSEKFWISLAYAHMNKPDQSFYGDNSPLPSKYSVTGGYKFLISKNSFANSLSDKGKSYLIPTAHYKSQGKSDQLDLGVYAILNHTLLGIWYRGLPIKNYSKKAINNESVVVLLGYKIKNFSIGYSYDFTVSKLTTAKTGGAHELNITFLFGDPKSRSRPMKKIPCPDFD